jgi:2'-5' RNA ligase
MTQHDLFGDSVPASPANGRSGPLDPSRQDCFFALRPSEADLARIDALIERLLAAHGVKGARVTAERLHITLEPIGWADDVESVEAACRAADMVRMPAVDVTLDAAMTYRPDAFVLVGANGSSGLAGVHSLRTALGCALADRGFRPKAKFNPHMTLSYDPRSRVEPLAIDPISFRATEFVLVRSHLGQSRHEVLRSWPLKA